MKYLVSLSIICFTFAASANYSTAEMTTDSSYELNIGSDRGKKARKNKRIKKRRKRKCAQFAKRSYAG